VGGGGGHGAELVAVGEGEEALVPVFGAVLGFGGGFRGGKTESEPQLFGALVGAPDGADRESGDTDTGNAPEGRHGAGVRDAVWRGGGVVGRETIPNKNRKSRKATVMAGEDFGDRCAELVTLVWPDGGMVWRRGSTEEIAHVI